MPRALLIVLVRRNKALVYKEKERLSLNPWD